MHYTKPKRTVHTVWLHCSAASRPSITAKDIDNWHRQRGWSGIGYHYFIRTDGTLETGRPLRRVGAHVKGYNTGSIGICLNGLHEGDFTEAQFETLRKLCDEINEAHGGRIRFRGHREVAAKLCPVFDYKKVLGLTADGQLGEDVPVPRPKPNIETEMMEEPKTAVSQKPVLSAKEIGACGGVLASTGTVLSAVDGPAELILTGALAIAIVGAVGFAGYRMIQRVNKTR